MKNTTSLVSSLVVSSALFWSATIKADEAIIKTPLDLPGYCHMQFPEMRSDTLDWDRPVLENDSGRIVDFYGPCDHDPTGADAIRGQRRTINRGFYGDGD